MSRAPDRKSSTHVVEMLPLDTVPMRVDEFTAIPDWIGQRDTERHLAYAIKRHLSKFAPTQARVAIAVLPDGRRYKLDGHTRALAWRRGLLKPPPMLLVDVHYVRSVDEARERYREYDAPEAAETAGDRVFEALREAGLVGVFSSSFMRRAAIARALFLATGMTDMRQAVESSKLALLLLDSVEPTRPLFRTGIVAAALVDFMARGSDAMLFWRAYRSRAGTKNESGMDGPEALARVVENLRAARSYGGAAEMPLVRTALTIVEGHARHRRWRYLPRLGDGPSPEEYLRRHGVARPGADDPPRVPARLESSS